MLGDGPFGLDFALVCTLCIRQLTPLHLHLGVLFCLQIPFPLLLNWYMHVPVLARQFQTISELDCELGNGNRLVRMMSISIWLGW